MGEEPRGGKKGKRRCHLTGNSEGDFSGRVTPSKYAMTVNYKPFWKTCSTHVNNSETRVNSNLHPAGATTRLQRSPQVAGRDH